MIIDYHVVILQCAKRVSRVSVCFVPQLLLCRYVVLIYWHLCITPIKVQELRGNIRVFCRCRYDDSAACALKFDASGMVVCSTAQGRKKAYDFEKIFTPDTTQEEVNLVLLKQNMVCT